VRGLAARMSVCADQADLHGRHDPCGDDGEERGAIELRRTGAPLRAAQPHGAHHEEQEEGAQQQQVQQKQRKRRAGTSNTQTHSCGARCEPRTAGVDWLNGSDAATSCHAACQ
jgi:hypothetical protein